MANTKSAIKRIKQNRKRRLRNRRYIGSSRVAVNKARKAIEKGDVDEARKLTRLAASALDKAAERGSIHKNNASRRKSRLMKMLAALERGQS